MTPSRSYCEIRLTQGKRAIVNKRDYKRLAPHKWCAANFGGKFYAVRGGRSADGKKLQIYMHREILGLHQGDPRIGDHRNPLETLNNTRANLRITDCSGNARNQTLAKSNKSGFKGVSRRKNGRWAANIRAGGPTRWLGYFATAEAAYEAYCRAAKELHGEFARLA